jgi:hypothetical protein
LPCISQPVRLADGISRYFKAVAAACISLLTFHSQTGICLLEYFSQFMFPLILKGFAIVLFECMSWTALGT